MQGLEVDGSGGVTESVLLQLVDANMGTNDSEFKDPPELCGHTVTKKYWAVDNELMIYREKPMTTWQRFITNIAICLRCCYVFCCPPCVSCIIHKMAFVPPTATYRFLTFGSSKNGDYRIRLKHSLFDPDEVNHQLVRAFYVENGSKRIACVYCRSSWSGIQSEKTVLMSHSNAEDLGLMLPRIVQFSCRVAVDVLAYDYSGYGCSNGSCSEQHLYQNVEHVYDFMIKKMKIPWQKIVAVGTSLGTAATIHLASRRELAGVLLQGSFASALRTVNPNMRETSCLDRFINVDKIVHVRCPTLFVHGENDRVFSPEHMALLMSRCPGAANVQPLVIEGGEHVDFERFEEYWQRVAKFLGEELKQPAVRPTSKKMSESQVNAGPANV